MNRLKFMNQPVNERVHLEAHSDLYQGPREPSSLAVYFPYATLPFDWRYAAPLTFAACQTLIAEGVPFRIVGPGGWDGVDVLIVPPGSPDGLESRLRHLAARGGRVVALGEDRGIGTSVWLRERPGATFLERHPALRAAVGRVTMRLFRAYFSSRLFRRLLDRASVTQRAIQGGGEGNPLFAVPPVEERAALPAAADPPPLPQAEAEDPVLITWWRLAGNGQRRRQAQEALHLVNYADGPQDVTVRLPWSARVQVLSPDTGGAGAPEGHLSELRINLDVYTVLLCEVCS
jgi:hypothetical protein